MKSNSCRLQTRILAWYARHKRDLPWRNTADPYRVLVSEMMLQQTQVSRVIPKYRAFLKAFPTLKALAAASPAAVLTRWSGLGYNRRAVLLQRAAQRIMAEHRGIVPTDRDALLSLPGIGPYTASAILSFAFNLPYPCIDTNSRRVLMHEFHLPKTTQPRELENIASSLIPEGRSRDWHNALMDYGATVLTAKRTGIRPIFRQSPFRNSRRWYRGQIMKILVKQKKVTLKNLSMTLSKEKPWLRRLLRDMQTQNLLKIRSQSVSLP